MKPIHQRLQLHVTQKITRLKLSGSITAKAVTVLDPATGENEERYIITDIIGSSPDLGVENLRGSGTIAGIQAEPMKTFLHLHMSQAVVWHWGLLVRLGQRTIQKVSNAQYF